MAARPDDRMMPVELVDDDVVDGPSPWSSARRGHALAADAEGPPDARPHGALVRWAVAGVVLGAITVVSVATTRGTTEVPVAPGVLAEPLREVWAAPADEVLAVRDGVVLVQSTGTRAPRVRALDQATGRELWSTPLGGEGPADVCEPGLTATPPTVWCWRTPHWDPDPESGRLAISPQALVGLDAATGEVLTAREMDEPSAGWSVEGDDVLLGAREDDVVRLERVSPTGWRTVWSTEIPVPAEPAGLRHDTWIDVTDGLAVVHGSTTAVVDAADGQVLAVWTATEDEEGSILDGAEVLVTARGFAAWSSAVEGMRLPRATWHDREGRAVGEFTGELVEPAANDGSVPEVLLVTRDEGQTLVAVTADDGTDLWHAPLSGGTVVAREGGTVVVAADDAVTSYEVLSGARLWTRPVDGLHAELAGVSDGSTVVVTAVRSHRWTALAYRLDDGGLLWSAAVPGAGDVGLIPYPPVLGMLDETPVVWMGRTLVWVDA